MLTNNWAATARSTQVSLCWLQFSFVPTSCFSLNVWSSHMQFLCLRSVLVFPPLMITPICLTCVSLPLRLPCISAALPVFSVPHRLVCSTSTSSSVVPCRPQRFLARDFLVSINLCLNRTTCLVCAISIWIPHITTYLAVSLCFGGVGPVYLYAIVTKNQTPLNCIWQKEETQYLYCFLLWHFHPWAACVSVKQHWQQTHADGFTIAPLFCGMCQELLLFSAENESLMMAKQF